MDVLSQKYVGVPILLYKKMILFFFVRGNSVVLEISQFLCAFVRTIEVHHRNKSEYSIQSIVFTLSKLMHSFIFYIVQYEYESMVWSVPTNK